MAEPFERRFVEARARVEILHAQTDVIIHGDLRLLSEITLAARRRADLGESCGPRSPPRDCCGFRSRPETMSMKREANSIADSSTPISLLPTAAACANSPSTINSGKGGAAPVRQTSLRSPIIASTSSGEK